jgi:ornithine cyclodeaminase/alanine dehydrogenase-like protein (mu-crystallin family)
MSLNVFRAKMQCIGLLEVYTLSTIKIENRAEMKRRRVRKGVASAFGQWSSSLQAPVILVKPYN